MRRAAIALSVLAFGGLVWSYLPPTGATIDLPEVEGLLEPPVSHAKPVFLSTADHVYYRVRLKTLVAPWYSWTYSQQLRKRGVQFEEITTSRFAPGFRGEGWKIAMAREGKLKPYTIEYWKSVDHRSSAFPVFMRWPWLYVRLGHSVLQRQSALIVPDADTTSLTVAVPRFPNAVLRSVGLSGWLITLEFCAPATPQEILRFYGDLFGKDTLGQDVRSHIERRDFVVEFAVPDSLSATLMRPEGFRVAVRNMLFSDDPLVVYPPDLVARISPSADKQQPVGLQNLPEMSLYHVMLRYWNEDEARQALAKIAARAPGPGTSR